MVQNIQPLASPVEYAGVRSNGSDLMEIDSGQIMVAVSLQEALQITLRHGMQARHPLLQIIVSLPLIAVGFFPVTVFIQWFLHGGVFYHYWAWAIPMAVTGLWVFFTALKTGYFLDVQEKNSSKRLAFNRRADPKELETFLNAVEHQCSLKIRREI